MKPTQNSYATHRLQPLYYLAASVVAQAGGIAVMYIIGALAPSVSSPLTHLVVWAVTACALSALFKVSKPWIIFNALLGPSIVLYIGLELAAYLLVIPVFFSLLIYLPTFWTRVPYYPTSTKMYETILSELPEGKTFSFVDMGSGFGWLLFYLAKRRPQGGFMGVEISPLPLLVARIIKIVFGYRNVDFGGFSFWKLDISGFDYVYAFLAPGPMEEVWKKACGEMKSGSLMLINSFECPAKAIRSHQVEDQKRSVLYVYRPNK